MSIRPNDHLIKISEFFAPKIIGELNDMFIKVAKIKGDKIPWHSHTNSDEYFFVLAGTLQMEVEGMEPFQLNPQELFVVKKGLEHKVSSDKDCHILLIEQKETLHTGTIQSDITKSIDEQH